jgi:DNA invertase Pin-like site-specific DNA recombinase|tara:strand:+ start:428 stop:1090 length:663 start_codon:yes stop_codon:yes gene_type:complete
MEEKINIIYLRTSTEEQNPESQLKGVKELSPINYITYIEQESAWKDHLKQRPKFQEIIKLIKNNKVKALYVWDLDRIYRNRKLLVGFFKLCHSLNVDIFSYRQKWLNQISTIPNPWDEIFRELLIQIFGWIAEDESNKLSQRVKKAIRITDKGTYSYKNNKWGRKANVSKKIIEKVLELRDKGMSIRDIAKDVKYWDNNRNEKNLSKSAVHKIVVENRQG